mgnify:CR=1 FL=1
MAVVTVNEDVCKGCALCVDACPKHIMELDTSHLNKKAIERIVAIDQTVINRKGYHPAHCKDLDSCIGCAFCATMCPDVAITVEK